MRNFYVIHEDQIIDQFEATSLKAAKDRAHAIYGTIVTVEGE